MLDIDLLQEVFVTNVPIYIAYSGGVDSHVLLHAIVNLCRSKNFNNKIVAIHINHNINPNSQNWAQHCSVICKELHIEFKTKTLQPTQTNEDELRKLRYAAFADLIDESEHCLMLAHHEADQAETILFRLIRGTGINGATGMKKYFFNKTYNLHMYRPLLNIDKQIIIDYAAIHKINNIEDDSNYDINYDRNYIRHNIIPAIASRWPMVTHKLAMFADIALSYQNYFLANNQEIYAPKILLNKVQAMEYSQQKLYLSSWLMQNQVMFEEKHIQIIIHEILNAKREAKPRLKLHDKYVFRSTVELIILNELPQPPILDILWDASVNTIYVAELNLELNRGRLNLFAYDYIIRSGSPIGSRVKKIAQNLQIPYWERATLIRIYDRMNEKLQMLYDPITQNIVWQRKNID